MKNSFLHGFLVLIFSSAAFAYLPNAAFWKRREPRLRFTTAAQSVFRLNCSSLVTVQAVNASSIAVNLASSLPVSLSASGLRFYTDANCSTEVTSVTIPAGSSSTSFYFVASGTGTSDLIATATNYKEALQTQTSSTNPYIWTGGGANSNWNTGLNWSGGAAPGSSNRAVFDGSCVSNCSPNMTVNTSINAVRVLSGYTGTITQNAAQTLTVGSGGWFHESGTFAGGNSAVTISGPLTVAGGTYTSTSTTTTISSHFKVTGGVFTPGTTYTFSDRGSVSPDATVFNNVTFDPGNGGIYNLSGTLFVGGNLLLNNTTDNVALRGGVIDLKGNLTITNSGMPGTTEIKLTGSGTQNVDASAGNSNKNLPSLTIASSGTVNLIGNLNFQSNFTYTSAGVFNTGTAKLSFLATGNDMYADFGNQTYHSVVYSSNTDLFIMSDATVSNAFTIGSTISNAGHIKGPGKVILLGNLILQNHGAGQYGNLQVHFQGNTVQSVSVLHTTAKSPGIYLNTTGTVNFPSSFTFHHDFVYTAGTTTGLASVNFTGITSRTHTISTAGYSFNDVTFSGSNGNTYNISGAMNIAGNLNFNSTNNSILNGTINLGGNVTFTNFYANNTNITFNGSGDQTVTHLGSGVDGTMTVNKAGGTLRFLTTTDWRFCPFILTSGGVDVNAQTVRFESASLNGNTITKNGGTLVVGGTTVGTGAMFGGTVAP